MKRFYALLPLLIALLMSISAWADDLKRWDIFDVEGITYMVANTNPREVYVGPSRAIFGEDDIDVILEGMDKIEPEQFGAISQDYSGDIIIPSSVIAPDGKSYSVTGVGQNAFINRIGLSAVSIPKTITFIGTNSFHGCDGLTSITIPCSVVEIESLAFGSCTNLSSVIFENTSPIHIGDRYGGAFNNCNNLTSIYIKDLAAWCSSNFDGGDTYPIQCAGGVVGKKTHFYVNGKEVTNLIIPDGLSSIGSCVFCGDNGISSITISKSVTSINRGAFMDCSSVTQITSLIENPFALETAVFKGMFEEVILYVPVGTKAKYEATDGWKNFKNIVEMTPYDVLDDNIVAAHFLQPDEMGKVEIPEKVEIDGVEYTVTKIAEDAFKGNTDLTEVTIPGTVTTIGAGAFEGCTNLKAIYVLSPTPASLAAAVSSRAQHKVASTAVSQFEGIDLETCVLYVPFGSEQAYREAEGWKEFRHIVGVHGETDPALTVTANSYSREYGEENPVFEFTTEGATLDGEPVIECEATPASPVGTYNIIVKKGGVKNYNDTYVKGTLTITKAPLTVKVEDAEREQGKENPQFVLTYTGWKNNETESVLTKKPMATTTATKDSPAGVYDIVVNGGEAQNYELSYVSGTLTVTVPSSINLTPPLSQGEGAWYDLQGRKIKGQSVKKGVYVVNGRKVVIK